MKLLHDMYSRAPRGGLLLGLLVVEMACSTERGSAGVWGDGSTDGSDADGSGGDEGGDDGGDDGGGDGGDGSGDDGSGGGVKYDVGEGLDVGGGGTLPPTCEEAAEQETNQGCEFWAVDLPQVWWTEGDSQIPPEDDIYAVAVANASSNIEAEVEIFEGASSTLVDRARSASSSPRRKRPSSQRSRHRPRRRPRRTGLHPCPGCSSGPG